MQLAFKNQATGQYIKRPITAATHWHVLNYTSDINDAWLYPEEFFNRPEFYDKEPYIQGEIRKWYEKKGEVIIPVLVSIKAKEDYVWKEWKQ